MFIFVLSLVALVAFAAFMYFHKHPEQNVVFGTPVSKPVFEELEDDDEDEKELSVKVIVTYTDGTKETFKNDDGEVNLEESGAITIRPDDEHCITISPFAYKKVEEINE